MTSKSPLPNTPKETCPHCGGSGFETDSVTPCGFCGGDGWVFAKDAESYAAPSGEYTAFLEAEVSKAKTGQCPNCNTVLRPLHCCVCEGCDGCRERLVSPSDTEQLVRLRQVVQNEIHRQCAHCKNGLAWTEDGRAHYGYEHQGVVGITICSASRELRKALQVKD